ncbi:MAG: thioredoxin domain-containing protein [Nitrospirae bacterium]|nr:thioredoxin domain-containing protein [Candidatus Troglogloeales bacterium]
MNVAAVTSGLVPNRLIHETSPYLRQHAYNPVDWYPWGEEALEKAKRENKIILLSIGYSACHWCHVMERESFENMQIARLMNEHFVSIKVDREERPDLDQIYQSAVMLFIRRGGGWPLTMFLTPNHIPFYGGTYFPPTDRYGMPGFPTILQEVASAYQERPNDIAKTVIDVEAALARISEGSHISETRKVDSTILTRAVSGLSSLFDSTYGGFGSAPKFPSTASLSLFLRYADQENDETCLKRVTYTLGRMAWGGIYDQIGGGFHRYSTDAHWLTPHFEKMVYDNAQLAPLYFSTYQKTGDRFYLKIGEEILEYVLREMTDPSGGFYTTQDADSEGEEGKFFVWTQDEIKSLSGERQGDLLCRHYGVTASGNFEGKNILHIQRPFYIVAQELGWNLSEAEVALKEGRKKLFLFREGRPKPFRDEKILTNLNGLMIGAFVEGYQVTRKTAYLMAAENAARFVMENLYKARTNSCSPLLLRTIKDGVSKLNGYLDDYAYFILALLDLYEATAKIEYLETSRALCAILIEQFWDKQQGGFFFTSNDHEPLVARVKTCTDQSVPSGNAVATMALLKLYFITKDDAYLNIAEKTLQVFSGAMEDNSFATGNLIAAADFYIRRPKEIVVSGEKESAEMEALLANIYQLYLPNKVVLIKDSIYEKPTVYICWNNTCSAPVTEWDKIQAALLDKR